eukprot:scpid73873/ scgid31408/ Protein slowmo homolog 2
MKIFKTQHVFDYSWDEVSLAAYRKYPNEHSPKVTAVDVLKRYVDKEGRLHSVRLIASCFSMWSAVPFVKMLGLEGSMFVIERSVADPVEKTLTLRSRNISLEGLINVFEVLQYRRDPVEPSKTLLTQEASVTVAPCLISGFVEGRMIDVFSESAQNGRNAIVNVCEKIQKEQQSTV